MLSIGELAKLAGTTVRAVRYYHAAGVLPEPDRAANGYRRYGTATLVRLIRIRRLRELDVPLSRVRAVISSAETFDAVLAELDADLAERAEVIAAQRARIADLRDRRADPELPAPLGDLFVALRAAYPDTFDDATARHDKEAVLLVLALHPEGLADLIAVYRRLLDDSAAFGRFAALDRRFAALATEPADSPLVDGLLADLFADPAFIATLAAGDPADAGLDGLAGVVLADYLASYGPAQRRFLTLAIERAGGRVG